MNCAPWKRFVNVVVGGIGSISFLDIVVAITIYYRRGRSIVDEESRMIHHVNVLGVMDRRAMGYRCRRYPTILWLEKAAPILPLLG